MAEDNNNPTTRLGDIPSKIRIRTPEEIAAARQQGSRSQSLIGGKDSSWAGSFLGNVVEGAASVVASPFKAMDRALAAAAGTEYREDVASPISKLGKGIEDVAGAVASGDPTRDEDFSSKLGQGLGSTAGFLVPGAILGAGARGAAGIGGLGAAATGVEQAEDYEGTVRAAGGTIDPTKQGQALFAGMLPGTIEAVPLVKMLGRMDDIVKGGLSAAVKNTAKGTVEEALQEGIQSTAQNLIASDLIKYDPERNMFFDTPEAAAVGGGVGFLMNSVMSALGLRQRGKYNEAAIKAIDSARKEAGAVEEEQAKVNPATGEAIENSDIAKTHKLIQRYTRLGETDPIESNRKAYQSRVEELQQELRTKYFTKDAESGEYTSSAADRQEATDVLTGVGVEEVEQIDAAPAPFEGNVDDKPVQEAEPFPKRMGKQYRVSEVTNQKEINKFNQEIAKLRPEGITITAPAETFPTAEGIGVEEVEPAIEEINLDTTPAPQERPFFDDRPANTALADQLQRITEQRKRRDETDAAFEARKAREIDEAYRQRELQLADETQAQDIQPATTQPTAAPATKQTQEAVRSPEAQTSVVSEGGIVTKSGAGFKSEAIAKAQMKRRGVDGTITEYAPGQFAIVPKAQEIEDTLQTDIERAKAATRRQAGFKTTPIEGPINIRRQAGLPVDLDTLPPLETPTTTTDELIPSLRDREGIPTPNGNEVVTKDTTTPVTIKPRDSHLDVADRLLEEVGRASDIGRYSEEDVSTEQRQIKKILDNPKLSDKQKFTALQSSLSAAIKKNNSYRPTTPTVKEETIPAVEDEVVTADDLVTVPTDTEEFVVDPIDRGSSTNGSERTVENSVQTNDITTKAGNPFKTSASAKAQMNRMGLVGSHEIAEVDGGFVLRPTPARSVENNPVDDEAGYEPVGSDLSTGTIQEVVNSPVEKPEQIPLNGEVYDEVIRLADAMRASQNPQNFTEEVAEKFGSVQQFLSMHSAIEAGYIVREGENSIPVTVTPAGTVETTESLEESSSSNKLLPDEQVEASLDEVESRLNAIDVEIADLQDELDSGYAESPSDIKKQIARLKKEQKQLESQQQNLHGEKQKISEDEIAELKAIDSEVTVFEDNGIIEPSASMDDGNVIDFKSKEHLAFKRNRQNKINRLEDLIDNPDTEEDMRINAESLLRFMRKNKDMIPDIELYLHMPVRRAPNEIFLGKYAGQVFGEYTLSGVFVKKYGKWRAKYEGYEATYRAPESLGLTQEELDNLFDWRNKKPSADLDPSKIIVKEEETDDTGVATIPRPSNEAISLVKRVVDRFVSQMDPAFRKLTEFYVVADPSDIPNPKIRADYIKNWEGKGVNGLYYQGTGRYKDTILIMAKDGRTRDQVEWTVFHEVIGHFGFKRMFGNSWDTFLDIALKNPQLAAKAYALGRRWTKLGDKLFETKGLKDAALMEVEETLYYVPNSTKNFKDQFIKRSGPKHKVNRAAMRALMDEYIAEIAGNMSNKTFRDASKEEISLMNRIRTWIRHLFRKAGIQSTEVVTEGDILSFVSESYTRILGTGPAAVEGIIEDVRQRKHEQFVRQHGMFYPIDKFIDETSKAAAKQLKLKNEQILKMQAANVNNPGTNKATISPSADLLEARAAVEESLELSANLGHIVSKDEGRKILKSIIAREGRLDNSAHHRRVERVSDWIRRTKVGKVMSSNGHLPFVRVLNAIENWTKGGIEKGQLMARKYARKTRDLNDIQKKAIFDYFKTKNADVSGLPVSEEIKQLSKQNKDYIEKLGESLVVMGVLRRETWEADRGSYLTIRYFHYLEGYYATGGKRMSFQNYLKQQKGLSKEEKAALGEIKDPSFLVPETVATISRDVALNGMFKNIITMDEVGKLGWTLGERQFTEVDGKKMKLSDIEKKIESLTFLKDAQSDLGPLYKDEQDQQAIEAQLQLYMDARTAAKNALRDEVRQVLAERGETEITQDMINHVIDREYVQVNDKRYGALHKKYIRKELYDEIIDSSQFYDKEHADFFGKAFGAGGYADRANQRWKSLKVTLNPPSWFRNGMGNLILMDIGTNTSMGKLIGMTVDEVNSWIKGNPSKYFQIAHDNGLWATTYSAAELNLMSQQFQDAFKGHVTINTERNFMKKAWWMFDEKLSQIFEKGTEIYGNMEGFFKTVALRDYIQRWEKQSGTKLDDADANTREAVIREAVEAANNNIFDYSKVPGWMRTMRRRPFVGAPFLTYTFKAFPYVMDSFARRPQKFIKYMAMPYMMAQAFMLTQDLDDEDYDEIMRMMPSWQKEKSSIFLLPFKDNNGNFQTIDFGYYLPWAPFQNMGLMAANTFDVSNPLISSGNTALKLGTDLGFLGGPLPQMINAVLTNKDPFSGREIVRTVGTAGDKQNDFMRYMVDMWTPTFLTSKGVLGRTLDNLGVEPSVFNTGQRLNALGKDKETFTQSSLRGLGISVRPFDPQLELRNKVKTYQYEKRKIETARRQIFKDRNLSPESRASKVREMNEQIKLLNQKHREELYGG